MWSWAQERDMELQEAAGSGAHSFRDKDGGQHVQGEQEKVGGPRTFLQT